MLTQHLFNKSAFFANTTKTTPKFLYPTARPFINRNSFNYQPQARTYYDKRANLNRGVEKTWSTPWRASRDFEFTSQYHYSPNRANNALFISDLFKNNYFWLIVFFFGLGTACYFFSEKRKNNSNASEDYPSHFDDILQNEAGYRIFNKDNSSTPLNDGQLASREARIDRSGLDKISRFLFGFDEENELIRDLEIDENFGISNFISDIFEMDNFGSRVTKYRVWEQNKNQIMKMVQHYIAEKIGTEISFEKKMNAKIGRFQFEGVHVFRTEDYSAVNNCAKFDLTIDKVIVNTSVLHFILGKGFITSVELEGVKGIFDRRTVQWSEEELANYRKRSAAFGDFEFKNFSIKDMKIDVFHPYPNRAIALEISEFKSNLFRQNWLIYDLFTAESIKGYYDGSRLLLQNYQDKHLNLNRLRFEELNYDNITSGYPENHPMSWITNGKINVEFNYQIPNSVCIFRPIDEDLMPEKDCYRINKLYPIFYRVDQDEMEFTLSMDLLYLEAEVPQDHSLINNTLYNMMAYYSKNSEIPINVSFTIPLSDFNGALYPYDIQLFEKCGNAIYDNFYQSIVSQFVKISFRNLWISSANSLYYAIEAIKSTIPGLTRPSFQAEKDVAIANMFDQS